LRVWEIAGVVTDGSAWGGFGPRWQVNTTEISGSPQLIINAAQGYDGYSMLGDGEWDAWGWSAAPSSSDPAAQTGIVGGISSIDVVYVRRAAYAALDPHVADAVAMQTAARGCYAVTGDASLKSNLQKTAEGALILAISTEGTQEGGQPPAAFSIPRALRRYARL
jgi:hypothetical protein